MKGRENQWERTGKITQLLSVYLKRGAGSIFPHCSSERTRQARPGDHSAQDESSAQLSTTETHWLIFLTNPQQCAAEIDFGQCSSHLLLETDLI